MQPTDTAVRRLSEPGAVLWEIPSLEDVLLLKSGEKASFQLRLLGKVLFLHPAASLS